MAQQLEVIFFFLENCTVLPFFDNSAKKKKQRPSFITILKEYYFGLTKAS